MILSPIRNTLVNGKDTKPTLSQRFGEHPEIYTPFGLKGHNGLDFSVATGTAVYAPFDGTITTSDEGTSGYGQYIRIKTTDRECVLAHLSKFHVQNGQVIHQGDLVAESGNTGFSTGPHLHFGFRTLKNGQVVNANNGYAGYWDVSPYLVCWRETLV